MFLLDGNRHITHSNGSGRDLLEQTPAARTMAGSPLLDPQLNRILRDATAASVSAMAHGTESIHCRSYAMTASAFVGRLFRDQAAGARDRHRL